jgi:hypothetical protein
MTPGDNIIKEKKKKSSAVLKKDKFPAAKETEIKSKIF